MTSSEGLVTAAASGLAAVQEVRPAGGAELDQIIIASVAGTVLTAGLLLLGWGHRTGRSGSCGCWPPRPSAGRSAQGSPAGSSYPPRSHCSR